MAPSTPSGDDSHQQLLDSLDMALKPRPFRNPAWKPSQRRNKNIKQIIGEAARREAAATSALPTQNNSGSTTPAPHNGTGGAATPNGAGANAAANGTPGANIAQAAQSLSTLVLERNMQASMAAAGAGTGTGAAGATTATAAATGPVATYTNIESAPSLHPAHQKPYCDITGLPAPYTDPKTRLRYHDREVFGVVRSLPQGVAEQYLAARGAHVVLK